MKYIKILLPILIIAIGIIIFIAMMVTKPSPKKSATAAKTWMVNVLTVKPQTIAPNLILYGKVETPRYTTLESDITAYVKSTPILEGNLVKKGQLIIELNDKDAKIALRQRQAEVASLNAEIKMEFTRYKLDQTALKKEKQLLKISEQTVHRYAQLADKKWVAAVTLDKEKNVLHQNQIMVQKREYAIQDHTNRLNQLKSKLAKAEALADDAKLDLERTKIIAPFNGYLTDLFVSIGDRVQPGEKLAKLYDISALEVRTQIPHEYIFSARKALDNHRNITASIQFNDKKVPLKLSRLSSHVSKGHSGMDALFTVQDHKEYLPLGQSLEVTVNLLPIKHVVAIPAQSLYRNKQVYKVVGDHIKAVNVEVVGTKYLETGQEQVLIRSSQLKTNDQIVTTSLPNAVTGLKVKVIKS